MALDFPSNPSDGEIFGSYVWSASKGVWQAREESATVAITSPTKPLTASNGDIWYNTTRGISYVYYDDGSSSQWVEIVTSGTPELSTKADLSYTNTQLALKANLSGGNTFSGTQNVSGTVNATSFTTSNVSVIPKFLQVVNNGSLATDYSFTIAQRSVCQFAFSASGYSNAQVLRNWTLVVNSSTVAQTKHFFNSVSFHAACLTGVGTITLNAGTYNARVNYDGTFDSNDFCTIWATIIPTA